MKITDVKTFVVGNPPPHFGGRYWVFLKLTTDNGIEGIGEAYSVPFHPSVMSCEKWRNIARLVSFSARHD